jgi:hypothetical protein
LFKSTLKRNAEEWEQPVKRRSSVRLLAILTLLTWVSIIVLGRLIAYDHVWGSWSMVPRV